MKTTGSSEPTGAGKLVCMQDVRSPAVQNAANTNAPRQPFEHRRIEISRKIDLPDSRDLWRGAGWVDQKRFVTVLGKPAYPSPGMDAGAISQVA
jgi:hypothetical protein